MPGGINLTSRWNFACNACGSQHSPCRITDTRSGRNEKGDIRLPENCPWNGMHKPNWELIAFEKDIEGKENDK